MLLNHLYVCLYTMWGYHKNFQIFVSMCSFICILTCIKIHRTKLQKYELQKIQCTYTTRADQDGSGTGCVNRRVYRVIHVQDACGIRMLIAPMCIAYDMYTYYK